MYRRRQTEEVHRDRSGESAVRPLRPKNKRECIILWFKPIEQLVQNRTGCDNGSSHAADGRGE